MMFLKNRIGWSFGELMASLLKENFLNFLLSYLHAEEGTEELLTEEPK